MPKQFYTLWHNRHRWRFEQFLKVPKLFRTQKAPQKFSTDCFCIYLCEKTFVSRYSPSLQATYCFFSPVIIEILIVLYRFEKLKFEKAPKQIFLRPPNRSGTPLVRQTALHKDDNEIHILLRSERDDYQA